MGMIWCDVDGVVRDFVTGVMRVTGERVDVTEWDAQVGGMRLSEWAKHPYIYDICPPYPQAGRFVQSLPKPVFFITTAPYIPTVQWLSRYGFLHLSSGLLQVHSHTHKLAFLGDGDWLIDDCPHLRHERLLPVKRPWNPSGLTYDEIIGRLSWDIAKSLK